VGAENHVCTISVRTLILPALCVEGKTAALQLSVGDLIKPQVIMAEAVDVLSLVGERRAMIAGVTG
jgi:hypothetical protein